MTGEIKRITFVSVTAILGLSVSACSTTPTKIASAAPITYKVDQGGFQQASITRSYAAPVVEAPKSYVPAPVTPKSVPAVPKAKPQSTPKLAMPSLPKAEPWSKPKSNMPLPQFDQSQVDKTLYAHQRVGKTYTIMGKPYTPKHQPDYDVTGTASWYGDKFHGKLTASGEVYDMHDITAAHKTLPLNSLVYVTNVETGQGMEVRINDRGPFIGNRIIDLSKETARRLGLFESGLGKVRVQYAGPADPMAAKKPAYPRFAPVQPRQKPEAVAEAPQPKTQLTPEYQPLRALPGEQKAAPPAMPVAKPENPLAPYTMPNNRNPLLDALPKTKKNPSVTAPALPPKPEGDAPVTLTIKGPVHLAVDKVAIGMQTGEFIPAINYRTIPAKK